MPHLIVIGGGAAGFFCAVNAARMRPDLQVTLLEKTGKLLSKVKVSGGGRCNVTHALDDIGEMSRKYPRGQHFVKKSFHRFFTSDTIEWFALRGVQLKTEADGRMFPVTDSSQTVIDCLLREAHQYGVSIKTHCEAKAIVPKQNGFTVEILEPSGARQLQADFVCLSAGGYSKSSQFDWLQNLGHTIEAPVPSLFTFNLPKHPITQLMGLSADPVRIRIEGTRLEEEGPVLVTHWGLSGPCVLRLSAWGARELAGMNYHFKVHVNWLPRQNEAAVREAMRSQRQLHAAKKLSNYHFGLPQRLWQFLLEASGIGPDLRFADLPSKLENTLIRHLTDHVFEVQGKTTFKEEFVTAGGVRLSEIDPSTMMSRKLPGLFFAGELLDVDGITGGFNFQHAWTSGWTAANAIANS